jgi:peptidoglycan/LPS O-acetylase OafA/YrhL
LSETPEAAARSPALAPPPGNPAFPLLDGARGWGAILVVLGHSYGGPVTTLGSNLVLGLDAMLRMFFALSAFLLFRPYLMALADGRPWPRPRDFLARRALRIVPGYWAALVITPLVLGAAYAPGALGSEWWRAFFFLQVYSLAHNAQGLAVAWTLGTEVGFYLLLPLLASAARVLSGRWGWRRAAFAVCVPLFVVGPVLHYLDGSPIDRDTVLLVARFLYAAPGQAHYFAIGMLLAVASVHVRQGGSLPRWVDWLVARPVTTWGLALAAWLVAELVMGFQNPLGGLDFRTRLLGNSLLMMIFAGLLLLPLVFDVRDSVVRRFMGSRAMVTAGVLSVGIYLWHSSLIHWLASRDPFTHLIEDGHYLQRWAITFALSLGMALVAGTLSYRLIELPFLRRKPGLSSGQRSERSAAPVD